MKLRKLVAAGPRDPERKKVAMGEEAGTVKM